MKRLLLVALALAVATPLFAQTPWIHVAVDETGEDDTRVNVNLPLSVVQVALEAAPDKIISDGKLHLRHIDKDLDVETLRKMWAELRETGDAEFVTIEKENETVRVRREGDFIRIYIADIDDRADGEPEQVHVDIPVTVVDALFSGDGETLNIKDALAELSEERGDIVRVDDGETKVRIWIDERD
ncbi:MAG: hypothetical protein BMS9Abin37_1376 [Acidobacteriota bacterium]|nr:MAG: hypothetical protein BMS9Abin37_1376 [Acidobacteriota bacterium]